LEGLGIEGRIVLQICLKDIGYEGMDLIHLALDRDPYDLL